MDAYSDYINQLKPRLEHLGLQSAEAAQALSDFGTRYEEITRKIETDELHELADIDIVRLALLEEGSAKPDFRYNDEIGRRAEERSGIAGYEMRWVPQISKTPSGKLLFRCRQCFRFSTSPDKQCGAGCSEPGSE